MKKYLSGFIAMMIILLAGCNMPSRQETPTAPDAALTQSAETVAAVLTRVALQASPTPKLPTSTPTPTNTPLPTPTKTLMPTPTNTPIPCLLVGYTNATIDQTVPDNTVMVPGQEFIKTWRLKNIGTCTWNSSYQLVFDRGDGMGVPTGYAQSLTSGSVLPGQTVDVSVNLVAPTVQGTYTGYWRFRDPNGIYFGIKDGTSPWIVKINVINSKKTTLLPVEEESGSIQSDGSILPGVIIVGDTVENYAIQAFISYDISDIPSNATILEVKNNFTSYTANGRPIVRLGVLNGYKQDFSLPLQFSAFKSGFPSGDIIDWSSLTLLEKIEVQPLIKTALQAKIGDERFKLRLQFAGTNSDGIADYIDFSKPSLIVTYSIP